MNIFGSTWQGGVFAKIHGRLLGLKYALGLMLERPLSHTQMDMGIAFLLRFTPYARLNPQKMRIWAIKALSATLAVSPPVAHQIALAHVRLAEIALYLPTPNAEVNYRCRLAYGLKGEIIAEGDYGRKQLSSILRHLGEIAIKTKNYRKAQDYLSQAMSFADEVGAVDQMKKINRSLKQLDRLHWKP